MGQVLYGFRFGARSLTTFVLTLVLISSTFFSIPGLITPASAIEVQSDTSIDLNGTNQYGYTGDSIPLRTFNAITIEAWIMPQATCNGNIIVKSGDYGIWCSSGNLAYGFGGASVWVGEQTLISIPTNEWHHVALTRSASTDVAKLYFDGQLLYTGTADSAGAGSIRSSTNTFLNIGARAQGATFFNGLVDEVRIFNSVRSEAQIASDMHTWGNLGLSQVVAYYDFNSVSGSTVQNKASNPDANSNLTLVATPTFPKVETTVVSGNARIVSFPRTYLNSDGGYALTPGVFTFRALIIAGGGGGGNDEGGGGGGGGFIESTTIAWDYSDVISIKVGQGGLGSIGTLGAYATDTNIRGDNGQDSQLGNIVAIGGGAGGTSNNTGNSPERAGASGGSGGGGAGEAAAGNSPGAGVTGQGFIGGSGITNGIGGGGGGAGEAGSTDGSGAGGDGKVSSITGSSVTYAGGGGGGFGNTTGGVAVAGGDGGGGSGGDLNSVNSGGTANTGGGGGGGCGALACGIADQQYSGANGGSGLIIIRFLIDATAPTFSNSSTVTVDENISTSTIVLTIQVSESSTLSLASSDDFADFAFSVVDSDTANIRFALTPDFEAPVDIGVNNVYNISILAVDVASNSTTQAIAITVRNLNEGSTISAATLGGTAYKGLAVSISATSNVAGKVTFLVNSKRIANCISRPTTGTYPNFTATCSWKPTVHNNQYITAELTPTDGTFATSRSGATSVFVNKRATTR